MDTKLFRGVFAIPQVAFKENDALDYEQTLRCVQFLLDCKVHGMVLPVYASESGTLTEIERNELVRLSLELVDKRVPVVVGVSSERIQSALSLAEFACAHGADAINTANPTALSMGEVVDYFKRIDEVINVPLFIQNLGPAFGGKSMTAEVMTRIIEQSKNQCYVKEEGAEFLKVMAQMTAYQKNCPEKLLGVFGGQGCRFLFEEIRRGSVGTMPPSQLADVMVDIWNLAEEGKQQEAFDLFTKVLPLLLFFGNNKIPSYKEILKRRGVFTSTRCRPLNWPMMDEMAHKDLDFLMEQIEPSLRVRL